MSTDIPCDLTEPISPPAPSRSPVVPFAPPKILREGVDEKEIPAVLVKKDCPKCFGRGWTARFRDGSAMPCACVLKETRRRHLALLKKKQEEKK